MTNNSHNPESVRKHKQFKPAVGASEQFTQYCSDYDVIPTRRQQSKFRTRGQHRMQTRRQK